MRESDVRICELLKKENNKGIEYLFEIYYKPLVVWADTFLHDIDRSEDLVQDFFVKLWKNKVGEYLLPETLKSYLYISIRNLALNSLVKIDPLKRACDIALYEKPWEEYTNFEEEILKKVEEAIEQLPSRSREIVRCVYLKGLSYKQTADKLNISVATVNSLLVIAMRKLRQNLSNRGEIYIYLLMILSGKSYSPNIRLFTVSD